MGITEIFFVSIGLGMDAFAVSICKGLSMLKIKLKGILTVAIYFGIFQALMPYLGYILAKKFGIEVVSLNGFIAFILLSIIGINMIKEAFSKKEDNINQVGDDLSFKTMVILGIATSIDALAVGVSFACLNVNIYLAILSIGIITFILSIIGVKIGNIFGSKYKGISEIIGGIILILMAFKILLKI